MKIRIQFCPLDTRRRPGSTLRARFDDAQAEAGQ
jgi:hypothetical protein